MSLINNRHGQQLAVYTFGDVPILPLFFQIHWALITVCGKAKWQCLQATILSFVMTPVVMAKV